MSEAKNTQGSTRDVFSACQQGADRLFGGAKQSIPQYYQSITNVQQEYIQAFEDLVSSAISMQKELAKKTGIPTNISEPAAKAMRDGADELVRMNSVQNQIVLATIDAAQQNIKAFGDGAKLLVGLNKSIAQSWATAFSARTN